MSFATDGHGNGNGTGDGRAALRPEDYAPVWPMVPGTRKIGVTINGQQVEAEEGQTILQACRVLGIDVPTLCYEPKLAPYGACRICVVEVDGHDDTPISCGTQIEEGMVITTHNERLIENRRMVLELIFSDHDAYCLPPCQFKCPTRVDIPGYLKQNTLGNWEEATRILKRSLPFPAILGRVCPAPCETHCRREEVDTAIAIRDSHRYCADRVLEVDAPAPIPWPKDPATGRRVAIIGAGPAGLSVAYYLQLRGHHCDVYEAEPEQGGMLTYGIPEYRLPKKWMDRELDHVWELGATLKPNMRLGRDFHLADLLNDGYDAIYVGIGCYKPNELGIPGEDADGVVNALENLYNSTRGLPIPALHGARVVVIGGGFTSIDCTRTSVRQGAAEVTLVYRRDLKDMPAGRGARGDRGGCAGHLPGRAGAHRDRQEQQGDRRRVPAHEAGRARREGPPPARADAGHRVRGGMRHRVRCHRAGPGPVLDRVRARRCPGPAGGQPARHAGQRGRHLPHRAAEGLRVRRRAHRRRHRGRGHRRRSARQLCHGLLAARPRPGRSPGAPYRVRAGAA
ncbi:MAG TPA: FAD-dependent oxidoreductase, partial [Candidatus Limnocylindria bacterium]|nr:FAD-dependent oxidoreductase [Candidatus Limnocylindria bacterium]